MHNRFCLLLCFVNVTYGANILFFFGVSTYSHRIVVWPLVEEMAAKGHNVTFFSPYTPKKPNANVTEVHPKELQDFFEKTFGSDSNLLEKRMAGTHRNIWTDLVGFGQVVCDVICSSPETKNWIDNSHIDLVVIDGLFNDCGLGIAYKFKAPHIIFDTTTVFMWQYDIYGAPAETSWIPDLSIGWPQQMSFLQRASNTLQPLYWYFYRHYFMYPNLETVLRSSLNMTDMPPLRELESRSSLVLTNTHYSLEYARSLPPLFVSVAGMHCANKSISVRNQNIPEDILKFIEGSGENGFVYISFGGAVQISKMKPEFQQIFFSALGSLSNIRFLWKWEADRPKEMPANVITAKWMPQQEILAHPKVRAFVTHGGLLGMEEAISYAVPLIVFPVFAEQDYNAERVHRDGYGISLEITTITKDILKGSIHQILTNKKYKKRMNEIATLFHDRITGPLESAVWWTEYVLRHKDTSSFLRPLAYSQTWYQRRLLDVWAFLSILAITIIGFLVMVSAFTYRIFVTSFYEKTNKITKPAIHSNGSTNKDHRKAKTH